MSNFIFIYTETTSSSSPNTPLKLLASTDQVDPFRLQASGMIDLSVLASTKSNDMSTLSKITYAVIETSVSFEYESSLLQNADLNCADMNTSQIISNVIMISFGKKYLSSEKFVNTKFKTHPVFEIFL